jgi:hypothetical protein
MMERGYRNVKPVQGGGDAMEKFFEYYLKAWDGGRIINPITGKVIVIKR